MAGNVLYSSSLWIHGTCILLTVLGFIVESYIPFGICDDGFSFAKKVCGTLVSDIHICLDVEVVMGQIIVLRKG